MAETFGLTSKGVNSDAVDTNSQYICKFTSGSAGSLTSISLYCKKYVSDASAKCAIYDSSKNLVENGQTEEKPITTGQDGWIEFNFSTPPDVSASTVYYLAWWFTSSVYCYYNSGGTDQTGKKLKTYNSWDDPIVPSWYGDLEFSIFATYVEAPPAKKTLVQAALLSIPPLIVLPTLGQILRLTGGF